MGTNTYAVLFALTIASTNARAQASGELNINDVRARFYAHGLIGYDYGNGSPNFEVPDGGGSHALFSAGLWFGGTPEDNQVRVAAMMYEPATQADYYPGPLTIDGSASTDGNVMSQCDQVWSVTSAEIALHTAYFHCVLDPDCVEADEFPDGYTVPLSFFDWPAINTNPGYATYLAPFFDFNADGDYDPSVGDAPCILGDQAMFFVFNDKGGPHVLTGGEPLGLEIQAMPFAYNSGDPALDQTIFVHYHIINRGTLTLSGARIGLFNDFDLGCADDDLIGTDAARNLTYVYNADDDDQNCLGAVGYQSQPPAFGMTVLKGPGLGYNGLDDPSTNALPSWNGRGFGDLTVDNERHGLGRNMQIFQQAPSCCNDPVLPSDYLGYMSGVWKDGVSLTYGGTGYSTDPGAVPAAFAYPGDSDPVGAGTSGLVQSPWSQDPLPIADSRTISSMGPITVEPGQHIDLLFAYVYARAGSGGPLASLAALQARVDSVREFANGLPLYNHAQDVFQGGCEGISNVGVEEAQLNAELLLFPVPASDMVQFQAPAMLVGAALLLHDATGRTVLSQRVVSGLSKIDIAPLAIGVYTCAVTSTKKRCTGRLIKE